jgi:hypothetical protein
MAEKTLLDIQSENFDSFFIKNAKETSYTDRESLPRYITSRLFKAGGKLNEKFAVNLGFLGKIFVLWKALRKRVYIVVEDEHNGMTPGQFIEMQKALKRGDYSSYQASGLTQGIFVLAGKELSDSFSYLNNLSNSGAYNYLTKSKNQPKNPTTEYRDRMSYIVRFIVYYESNKKKWVSETGINMPEFLVLIALYHGQAMPGAEIYKGVFKRAYQSSPNRIKAAFGTLQFKGFITKSGLTNGAKMQITGLGTDAVNRILNKYAINC